MRTRVGYTGGTIADPTYHALGDHTESVQVDYDPTQITYAELLEVFWESHTPSIVPHSRQYMNAVFYHDDDQKALALATRDQVAEARGIVVSTEVLPAGTFYLAEDYHQKYSMRRREIFYKELAAIYPQMEDLIDSTAAARINGYLGGYGTREQLKTELDELGLSPEASERLLARVFR